MARLLAAVVSALALLIAVPGGAAVAAPGKISLSANVDRLTVRPCLPEAIRLGITNNGATAGFFDVYVDAERPLQSSKPVVTTYVPAGSTVYTNIAISASVDAAAGTYDVTFTTGRSESLTVPATVATSPETQCLPRDRMTATATSAQQSPDYGARYAIDGADATFWHTRYSPTRDVLPQSITLDLGSTYDVAELVYQPRTSGSMNGTITAYTVYGSADGETFSQLTKGTWPADRTRKTATVNAPAIRHLRLEVTEGYGGYASAAELVLFGR